MRISSLWVVLAFVVMSVLGGCAAGNTPTYANCSISADCSAVSDTCVLVMNSGSTRMCSRPCSTGTDCPTSRDGTAFGVCLPVATGSTYCYSHCNFDSDCPVGWMCNPGTLRGAACTPR
jgi:hypothetical protein